MTRVAPRAGQQANGLAALIEDALPLPSLLLLRSKSYLSQLYSDRQLHAGGLSLRQIAAALNQRLVPTKHAGVWQPNTVRKILARV